MVTPREVVAAVLAVALAATGCMPSVGDERPAVAEPQQLTRQLLHDLGWEAPVTVLPAQTSSEESEDPEVESDCEAAEDTDGRPDVEVVRRFLEGGAFADVQPQWWLSVSRVESDIPSEALRMLWDHEGRITACGEHTVTHVVDGSVEREFSIRNTAVHEFEDTPIHSAHFQQTEGPPIRQSSVWMLDTSGEVLGLTVGRVGGESDDVSRSMLIDIISGLDPSTDTAQAATDNLVPPDAMTATEVELRLDQLPGIEDPVGVLRPIVDEGGGDLLLGLADSELLARGDAAESMAGLGPQTIYRLFTDTGWDDQALPEIEQQKRPWHLQGVAFLRGDDGSEEPPYVGHWAVEVLLVPSAETRRLELKQATDVVRKSTPDRIEWNGASDEPGRSGTAFSGEVDGFRQVAIVGVSAPYLIRITVNADADQAELLDVARGLHDQTIAFLAGS